MTDDADLTRPAPQVPLEPLGPNDPREVGDGYRLLGRLGAGGTGVAYLADDGQQWTVVKVIRSELADDKAFRARLARELEAMQRTAGPHTAAVLASDLDAPRPWFAMEFIPGQTLARRVEEAGPLPTKDVADVAAGLATVLRQIHDADVIHRDLKPANIMLTPDGPKLIDFGIADLTDGTQLTSTGVILGSTGWISPEQVTGDPVTSATDIHAWGLCVLYAATGQRPFGADTTSAALYKVLETVPDVPTTLPTPLHDLVTAALAKDPAQRPTLDRIQHDLLPETVTGLHLPPDPTRPMPAVSATPVAMTPPAPPRTLPPPTSGDITDGATPGPRPRSLRAVAIVITAAAVGALVAGGITLAAARGGSDPEPAAAATQTVTATPTTTPAATQATPTPEATPAATQTKPKVTRKPQRSTRPSVAVPAQVNNWQSPSGNLRCAYFAQGTLGPTVACIDADTGTLARLSTGRVRYSSATASQRAQLPGGTTVDFNETPLNFGRTPDGRSLFTCGLTDAGMTCQDNQAGSWFVIRRGYVDGSY